MKNATAISKTVTPVKGMVKMKRKGSECGSSYGLMCTLARVTADKRTLVHSTLKLKTKASNKRHTDNAIIGSIASKRIPQNTKVPHTPTPHPLHPALRHRSIFPSP